MIINKILSYSLTAIIILGCTTPNKDITSDTSNAIAVCSGGYSTGIKAELTAELEKRNGELISSAVIEEKGVSAFKFAELQGRDAIDMYNNYVTCIDNRKAEQTTNNERELERINNEKKLECRAKLACDLDAHERMSTCVEVAEEVAYERNLPDTTYTRGCFTSLNSSLDRCYANSPNINLERNRCEALLEKKLEDFKDN